MDEEDARTSRMGRNRKRISNHGRRTLTIQHGQRIYIDSHIVKPLEDPPPEKMATSVTMKTVKINLQQDDICQIRFTHQVDGGANFAATDRLDLLHNYKLYIKPIATVAFFSQDDENAQPQESHTAIGEGILKLIGDYGDIIPMRMLYTPNSTGTVISPECTMKDMQCFNPKSNRIVAWSQNGGIQRSMQWKNKEGWIVSSLQMEERNGLYYIKNATLLPLPKPTVKAINTEHCKKTIQEIESRMQNPLNDLGTIKRFNGIDILQARDFVTISCETYINKIVLHLVKQNTKDCDRIIVSLV
jgi:hypothetical protein